MRSPPSFFLVFFSPKLEMSNLSEYNALVIEIENILLKWVPYVVFDSEKCVALETSLAHPKLFRASFFMSFSANQVISGRIRLQNALYNKI